MRVRLGEVCEIKAGGTPSRAISEYWHNGEIPWVKISDIQSKYLKFAQEYITEDGLKNSSAKVFPKGTILYSIFATLGEVSILDIDAATNQAIAGLQICNTNLTSDYLYYFLLSKKSQITEIGRGVAQNNINLNILRSIEMELPDLAEQTAIVREINAVEELIEKREQQLEKLDLLVKSQFIEMFGHPFDGVKWDTKKLQDVSISLTDGSNIDTEHYDKIGEVLFLRIQNVWRNEFRLDDSVYISCDVNDEFIETSLHAGDLLITKIGRYYTKDSSLGRVALYRGRDDKANYSNNIMRVRLNSSMNSEFVNSLLNLDDYQKFIKKTSKGGTDKRALSKALIGSYPIICPPIELQNEFASFVEQTEKSKSTIKHSLDKLETLKKALMQKYFGERRS